MTLADEMHVVLPCLCTVQGLRRQNTETSRYSIHSDTMSRSSSVSNMGPLASEQVIAQRDDAIDKCRRLQQQLFEERAAGGMSGASVRT